MPSEFVDPYIDQVTGVLKNLVGAKTYDELRNAEGELVSSRMSDFIVKLPLEVTGSLDDFCAIHRYLFQDMDASNVPMAGDGEGAGRKRKGIEDFLPETQYGTPTNADATPHQRKVVRDIKDGWLSLSRDGKFHALFATHSIAEAIQYYRLLKEHAPEIKVAGLFDPAIDNNEGALFKEDGLVELLSDYNRRYEKEFTLSTFPAYKKDVAARLAHKKPYVGIEKTPKERLDLLVVVDQMLTGFDSKWVNTLYLDKVVHYEGLIQAFSRTNRLFGPDKPFGVIRYYRRPHTMKREVGDAVKLYSGDKPFGLFVDKLPENIAGMNRCYEEIERVFQAAQAGDFGHLPQDDAAKGKFAYLFKQLNEYLQAARVQGFTWGKAEYDHDEEDGTTAQVMTLCFGETTYLTLALRYKELFAGVSIASVARRLGHSSMNTTQKTYLHIIQELENKDVDLVMRSLSGLV